MDPIDIIRTGSGSVAAHAVKSFLAALRRMPLLAGSTLVIAVLIELCIAAATAALPPDYRFLAETRDTVTRSFSFEQRLLAKLFEFSTDVARTIIFAAFAVATHRLIILDEATPGYISFAPARTRRFILWLVYLQLLLILPPLLPGGPITLIALFVALTILSVRLTLIFPAVAVDSRNQNFNRIWSLTQARFWRIALPLLYVFAPLLAITTLLQMWGAGTYSMAGLTDFLREQQFRPLLTQIPEIIMKAVGGLAFAGLGAAVASWLYILFSAGERFIKPEVRG